MISNLLLLHYLLFFDFGGTSSIDFFSDACFAMKTGGALPSCNRAYNTSSFTASNVKDILNFFGATPFTWVVDAHDSDTRTILQEQGMIYKVSFPAMHMHLDYLKPLSSNENIIFKEITQKEDFLLWQIIVSQSFGFNPIEFEKVVDYCRTKGGSSVKFYLAYYNNKPTSGLLAVYHGDVVSIHWVGTDAAYRGKGQGAAITHKALLDAQANGCNQAVLLASALGLPVYEKIGFSIYTWYQMYGNY